VIVDGWLLVEKYNTDMYCTIFHFASAAKKTVNSRTSFYGKLSQHKGYNSFIGNYCK